MIWELSIGVGDITAQRRNVVINAGDINAAENDARINRGGVNGDIDKSRRMQTDPATRDARGQSLLLDWQRCHGLD